MIYSLKSIDMKDFLIVILKKNINNSLAYFELKN